MIGSSYQKVQNYDWECKRQISNTGLSMLYIVLNFKTGVQVVIREYSLEEKSQEVKAYLNKQIVAAQKVSGTNIVQYINTFKFPQYLYVVWEMCDTNLKRYIDAHKGVLSESRISRIVCGIVSGMFSIRRHQCIHANLNPTNILRKGTTWKLTRFTIPLTHEDPPCILEGIKESKFRYLAPEVLLERQLPNEKSEIWSFGIILFELIYGVPPYQNLDFEHFKKKLVNKFTEFPEYFANKNVNKEIKTLMESCLNIVPSRRPNWALIALSPFVARALENFNHKTTEKEQQRNVLDVLSRLQRALMLQIGSASQIMQFCQGKLTFCDLTLTSNKLMDFRQLSDLCKSILPEIDPLQIRMVFKWIDTSGDGRISQSQFTKLVLESEFIDAINKFLDELSRAIKKKNIDAQKLFQNYDRNSSGSLDENQIREIARTLIPTFAATNLALVCSHIAQKYNGRLPITTIYQQYKSRNPLESPELKSNSAKKHLKSFRTQLKEYQVTIVQIVKNFDINKNNKLDFQEFKRMVYSVDTFIREDQLKLMFQEVDKDHSGTISIEEFKQFYSNTQ